jgi:hypothetical protein
MVFPYTTPDGRVVNLYGQAVGAAEEASKAKRHNHVPDVQGFFNAAGLRPVPGRCGSARAPAKRWRYSLQAVRVW